VARIIFALLLGWILQLPAAAQAPRTIESIPADQTPLVEAVQQAMKQSIGAPALASLGPEATIRLGGEMVLVPRDAAGVLLSASGVQTPPDLVAILLGPKGLDAPWLIRFVPAGFIDAAEVERWTADDLQSSLQDALDAKNPERNANRLSSVTVSRWILPPRYFRDKHDFIWAALILPTWAPPDADGTVTYNAAVFGRNGYFRLSGTGALQDEADARAIINDFLNGVTFRPGNAFEDVQPGDRRAANGLAAVLDVAALRKVSRSGRFLTADWLMPATAGLVAVIGALSLLLYIRRKMRLDARRW
jgi:uncharacterized membrane-anchored protein